MCYLIAKKFNDVGCLALQAEHGPHLANFKKKLAKTIGYVMPAFTPAPKKDCKPP